MTVKRQPWGSMPDGTPVELFSLTGDTGMTATVTNYGATLVSLTVPDRNGVFNDVVLGYDSLDGYLDDSCYFGCMVGRVANRIGNGRFSLDGTAYELDRNHGNHHLHGGSGGFNTRVWSVQECDDDGGAVTLEYVSDDGEQGYPGTLSTAVTYALTENGLCITARASTDETTVVNLTNHTCFNLTGKPENGCLGHELSIPASRFLEADGELIPTGNAADVAGTPMDFIASATIGSRIDASFEPLSKGQGYDHYYILDDASDTVRIAARVHDPGSGRALTVRTNQPGVQFYSGNHVPENVTGKNGGVYGKRSGFCLETQGYPDAPNHSGFPAVRLETGEEYEYIMEYIFASK